MPQYLSPGVYVEEVPSAAQPIAGVGTSTAAFVGQVTNTTVMPNQPGRFEVDDKGVQKKDTSGNPIPVPYTLAAEGVPFLVTSWEQFKNTFGDFQAATSSSTTDDGGKKTTTEDLRNRVLAHAVYGFFNNGGTRAWVVRVKDALSGTNVQAALDALGAIDEISLVAVPGSVDDTIQGKVVDHCARMGDRFAILDGRRATAPTAGNIRGGMGKSDYAAMYYPWIQVWDPSQNKSDFVPPSGHMAGIYARVDGARGVHKAPANEVVRGATGLERRVSKAEQDGLNPDGINVIRDFDGSIRVWGARTLGGDANGEWKYLSVRRTFLYLRKSIDKGTQWVVFEPNTPALWAKITRNITAFLTTVWRAGALFGNTAPEAFYVKCDAGTNPVELRDLGQVVTEIGVSVVRPAEFVIFRISQWSGPGAG